MYSVEDQYTFENLQEWIENAQDSVDLDSFVWSLIGNKCDLPLEIEHDSIKARCEQLGTTLSFFASAKTGENVINAFEKIIAEVHKKRAGKFEKSSAGGQGVVKVQGANPKSNKPNCCGWEVRYFAQ